MLLAGLSCAYYNTLYNARERFREAEKLKRDRTGKVTRQQRSAYEEVIKKCQAVIGTWPDSRHVDDAMLLIANSLYRQDLFGECVTQIDTLEAKYPKTNLMRQARLLKGRALSDWGEDEEALAVLADYRIRWPGKDGNDEALFYLAASAIQLGRNEEALEYVRTLQERFPGSPSTFRAQIRVAATLADNGKWAESEEVYAALNEDRLPIDYRYEVWTGLSESHLHTGSAMRVLPLIEDLDGLNLATQEKPEVLMLKALAYEQLDSLQSAIDTYVQVTRKYSRGEYGAEAHFRLGQIFEEADSLERAKKQYEQVSRSYARSEYATLSVRRAGSIGKLLRLANSTDKNSPEARALRAFTLAEIQFTQFDNAERAAEGYAVVVDSFPNTDLAPRAAYALTYLFSTVLHDSLRAAGAYRTLTTRYPTSQQAKFAARLLHGEGSSPPFATVRTDTLGTGTSGGAPRDSLREESP